MDTVSDTSYEVHIHPGQKWLKLDLHTLLEYRDLFFILVTKDFVVKYKQTILGPLWFFIQPLLTTVVFTFIFNRVGGLSTDGLPPMLFYLGGLTLWAYFSQNITGTSNTFGLHFHIFEKVYFPRLIVPMATVVSNLLALSVQLTSLIGFVIFFKCTGAKFQPNVLGIFLAVPFLILQTAALSLGFGLVFSSMTAKYRDLAQLVTFMLQLWMYASPIVYPASRLPDRFRWLIYVNPVAPIVESFRGCFLGITSVTIPEIVTSVILTILLLLGGMMIFQRTERNFVDTV
jgi:lipopolysaccharide transport system permease protein